MRHHSLTLAIAVALSSPIAAAQDHGDREQQLDRIVVTASPLRQSADDIARPVEVVAGKALDDARSGTLGDTLSQLPGVQSSFFGAAVGRPIIRGLDGARVQVLSEGVSSLDTSTVSVDHAVTIDPFLADQIEVLKGPATLLFGAGAVGGAVNVVDGRIHEQPLQGITGRAEVRGNTVADERAGAFRVDAGSGRFVFHVDGFLRNADDYEIPGQAERAGDDHHHDHHDHNHDDDDDHHHDAVAGILANSRVRARGGAAGFSFVGDRGFAGVALSRYENRYGVPGHDHHDDDDHDHDHDHHDHDDDDDDPEHGDVRIDMKQTRIDAKAGLDDPFAGHQSLRVRLASNNYRHLELEGDEIGTRFDNRGQEGRIELVHNEMAGWNGAYGLQYGRRDFTAVGAEAFVPASVSTDLGLFLLERRQWDRFHLELGGRFDRQEIDPDLSGTDTKSFNAFSASASGEWRFTEQLHLRLGFDRAQRAPGAEELFSDGLHVATASYEIGDSALGKETANQVELGLHFHGERVELTIATYRNRFNDFIYLADTGETDHDHAIRQWSQHDARFRGAEAEARFILADGDRGRWQARLLADSVRATLTDGGGHLPRIAPGRYGAGLEWQMGGWRADVSALRYRSQDRVAEHETGTPGYTLVSADLAYGFNVATSEVEVFVQGRNLGDEEIRQHTSFLKDLAPLPGRSIGFGMRVFF